MFSVRTPRMHAASATEVSTQTRRGRGLMKAPTRAQMPWLVGSSEPKVGFLGQNIQRPKMTSSAGSRVIIASSVTAMPMAHTGPRPAVEFMSASVRQSMPTMTVLRAGDDRRRRAVQGERHRLVTVLVTTELFSVSRDEQQGVVGAGADHQDRDDRLALPVDGEVGVLGEEVDQAERGAQGRHHREDRQDPEDRAAVGDQQQHDDHEQGGEQQGAVESGERLGGVDRLSADAGDVDGAAVDLGDLVDLLGDVGHLVPAVGRRGCRSRRSGRPGRPWTGSGR